MRRRAVVKFEPLLERFEEIQLLSGAAAAQAAKLPAVAGDVQPAAPASKPAHPPRKFYGFRITNPSKRGVNLVPPFGQVLVQSNQPVPGQVYNLMYVVVKNGTAQTFTASNNFTVRLTNQGKTVGFPVLTGTQQWKPKKWIVFYVLTKKYYRVDFVAGGFQLNLGGASTTLVPGPSSIFLRVKYNPATFARTLNFIVAHGSGAQLGKGPPIGISDTAINEIVAGRTLRIDYGGHF